MLFLLACKLIDIIPRDQHHPGWGVLHFHSGLEFAGECECGMHRKFETRILAFVVLSLEKQKQAYMSRISHGLDMVPDIFRRHRNFRNRSIFFPVAVFI